jgi:UDPglucose 6-dehydrogenase
MNFINAELTKISVNSFITTKITFANMLADLAAGLVGGNVDTVTSALGLDSRIGKRYLKGGLGYGGPCFPRDNAALAFVAKRLKIKADIPLATDKFNHRIIAHLFTLVRARIKPKDTVGILGLAYKPQTYVIEESQGFFLARALISAGIKVILYDPISIPSVKGVFGTKARYAKSASSAICSSDIVVIANPDPEFIRLKKSLFLSRKRPLTIIDCWRILRRFNLSGSRHIRYIPLGIHNPD